MATNVFVYGSLMEPQVWEAVTGASVHMFDATVFDHARYKIEDALYPAMVAEPGKEVRGKLVLDVTPEQLDRLNSFEGVGPDVDLGEYEFSPIRVICQGDEIDANTYLASPQLAERLSPEEWDPDFFRLRVSEFMNTVVRDFQRASGCSDTEELGS